MTHHCIMTYLQRGLNKEACIGTGALLLSQKVLDLKLTLVMQDQLDTKYKSKIFLASSLPLSSLSSNLADRSPHIPTSHILTNHLKHSNEKSSALTKA